MNFHSMLGQKIRTLVKRDQPAGAHDIQWDGKNEQGVQVSTGIYLYRLQTEHHVQIRKMMLIR